MRRDDPGIGTSPAASLDPLAAPGVAEVTDESLMAQFRDGDAGAFDTLLDRHKRPMYAFVHRSIRNPGEADDLFQEIFLRVIRAAPRWRADAKVTTWMYTIARNVLIDAARRRKTNPVPIPLVASPEEPGLPTDSVRSDAPGADQELVERERNTAVDELLAALPEEQREAFLLKREGLTFEEIAVVVKASKNTVKSRLRYALGKLRAGLGERGLLGPAKEDAT